jgi:hypothetical protein
MPPSKMAHAQAAPAFHGRRRCQGNRQDRAREPDRSTHRGQSPRCGNTPCPCRQEPRRSSRLNTKHPLPLARIGREWPSLTTWKAAEPSVWKAVSVFARDDKRLDHFRLLKVAAKLVTNAEISPKNYHSRMKKMKKRLCAGGK